MIYHPRRYFRSMLMACVVAAVWFACSVSAFGDEIEIEAKRFSIIDGDTLIVDGMRVRLHGIDAPEIAQQCGDGFGGSYSCGLKAKQFLETITTGASLECTVLDVDRYGRKISTCKYGAGYDLASVLVKNGHALDWPEYSNGFYAADQAEAEEHKRGIWAGAFKTPWEYRKTAG